MRYVAALLGITGVMISSFVLVQSEIGRNQHDAHLINISGRQRMLSQRLALLTREVQRGTVGIPELQATRDQMASAHAELITYHWPSPDAASVPPTLARMYRGEDGVDAQVVQYLAAVSDFVRAVEQSGAPSAQATSRGDTVARLSQSGLLEDLDAVVQEYERLSDGKTRRFRLLEVLVLILGLLLLLVEALFLFRPMVAFVDRAISSLQRSNDELTEFTYRLSHDLRAPIASCLGLTRVAEEMLDSGQVESARQALRLIDISTHRMDDYISQVLGYAHDRQSAEPTTSISVHELIGSVVQSLAHMEGFDRLDVQIDCTVDEPVLTRPVLLRHILENLLANAIKYQDPGQDTPWVRIGARRQGATLTLDVTDNGLGVPSEYRDQLFDMFTRFHPNAAPGAGLGLYLSQQNARAMGGSIRYDSQCDNSRFVVELDVQNTGPSPRTP